MEFPAESVVREYTAMALMGFFVISMVVLISWAVKRVVNKGLSGFDTIQSAIDVSNKAIWSLKEAVEENTIQLAEHRKESREFVERLSRENGRRRKEP